MRSTGADRFVVVTKAGNAAGAKGSSQAVVFGVQLGTGGDGECNLAICHGNMAVCSLDGSGVNREVHAPFCETPGVKFPRPTHHGLHWVLDVAFREDDCRVRQGHADKNFTTLRRIALHLLKQEKTAKVGFQIKRLMSGWDERYLLKTLGI